VLAAAAFAAALTAPLRADPVTDPFQPAPAPAQSTPAATDAAPTAAKPAPKLPDLAPIPAPEGPVGFSIDLARRHQTIENFGASDAWHSDVVGRTWPEADKREVARLLFSTELDADGRPRGIGLSLWRFNIGAGSAEQGDASGIAAMGHGPGPTRVECFLNPDGTYDWSKQAGQRWFLQAAKSFGVQQFIAFAKSPPVQYTRTGQAQNNREPRANLKEEHFDDFARFLGEIVQHFRDHEGITFRYLSPINEPQWLWSGGQQEGSPYTNAEMARVARLLDAEMRRRGLSTRIQVSEAGDLRFVYSARDNHADRQAHAFFDRASPHYIGDLPSLSRTFAAHGYFSDGHPDEFLDVRKKFRAELARYDLKYAMTEYCLLRDGLTKTTRNRPIPPIDSALQLARIIHADLAVADAVSWQFWTAMDTQRDPNTGLRYYLIERALDRVYHRPNKLLWTLGHFSRFIRPGYVRVDAARTDALDDVTAGDRELVSAYLSPDARELVVFAVNWRPHAVPLQLGLLDGAKSVPAPAGRAYVTTADPAINLDPRPVPAGGAFTLEPRSLTTFVLPLR
jgi:O-glycosyl hydrolase